jgi:transcription-repair coupling factor (superfamily II helicase)
MQLAMTGVKDLSIIASPPIDRRSIETFIFKRDLIVIKEALLNEKKRGGQSFYVVPRIKDISTIEDFIKEKIPEINYVVAHGQMSSTNLENRMHDFYEGNYDVLISTSIIESGLDLPNANTIVIHKANLFGLSQLYQIRGRVGRSNIRAYAYITYENDFQLGSNALKRLEAIQSLNSLGAGFNLASYDLDIRGSGNILGEQQSGHIKEIGVELYQDMLEETISLLKNNNAKFINEKWSPKITLDLPILIPSEYLEDVNIRMEIYRKLSNLNDISDLELFEVELVDRFGPYPSEVNILLRVISIKIRCKHLNIESIKKTKNGFIIQFKDNIFNNPEGLLNYIAQSNEINLKPDEKLSYEGLDNNEILNYIDNKLDDLELLYKLN